MMDPKKPTAFPMEIGRAVFILKPVRFSKTSQVLAQNQKNSRHTVTK